MLKAKKTYRPNIVVVVDSEAVEMTGRDILGLLLKIGNSVGLESLGTLTLGCNASAELALLANTPCKDRTLTIEGESVVGTTRDLDNVFKAWDEGRGVLYVNLVAVLVNSEHLVAFAVL